MKSRMFHKTLAQKWLLIIVTLSAEMLMWVPFLSTQVSFHLNIDVYMMVINLNTLHVFNRDIMTIKYYLNGLIKTLQCDKHQYFLVF